MSLPELENNFNTENDCLSYLYKLKWPEGFICSRCGNKKAWKMNAGLYKCTSCKDKHSITVGTIFEGTKKPLVLWFRAIWWIVSQKYGASAKGIQKILGFGSYKTAWTWLHKLRRAMVRPDREKLSGILEVDETFYGGEKSGKRGRGAEGKSIIGIAVEDKEKNGIGRIRLNILNDASANSLEKFIENNIEKGSTIKTDDWNGYNNLKNIKYKHEIVMKNKLKLAHLVASLLKRWLLGTHQGAVSHEHLEYYLDEFVFRFNRRKSTRRGKLFYRLLQNAVVIESVYYKNIKLNIRGKKPDTTTYSG